MTAPYGVAFWSMHVALVHAGRAIHAYPGKPIALAWLERAPDDVIWLPRGIGLAAWESALEHVGQPYTLCTDLVGVCVGRRWGCTTPGALRAALLEIQRKPGQR